MTISGHQEFWVTGSRLYFTRDDDVNSALLDIGVIKVASPTIEPEKIELEDCDGGLRRTIDEMITKIDESYEITINNLNLDNLALLFMANSSSPTAFTQTTTPITGVEHTVVIGSGKFVKLKDAAGAWLYNVTSISMVLKTTTTVTSGAALTEDVDWEWYSKERGIIKFLDSGSLTEGDIVEIDIVPAALTGKRLIYPQTGGVIRGKAMIVWGRGNNASQTVREADVAITPSGANFQVEDYSEFTLTVQVLSDITEITNPAGRLLQFKGTLPTA